MIPIGGHLALGFVILISLAIALVLVFLIVGVGVYVNHHRAEKEGYFLAPTDNVERYGEMQRRIRPQDLFGGVGRGGLGPGDSPMI